MPDDNKRKSKNRQASVETCRFLVGMTGFGLASARSPRGSDLPPASHSLPLGRSLRSLPATFWSQTAERARLCAYQLRYIPKNMKLTLNIYSHITDTMQQQAAVRIDREIGGTDAQMPEPPPPKVSAEPNPENATEAVFEPYKPKIRKSST